MSDQARNLGKCYLFTKSGRISKDLRDSIDGRISKVYVNDERRWPTTDFYIQTASLSSKAERAAATMSATLIIIPEMMKFLLDAIDAKCFAGHDVYLYIPGKAGEML
jgi:hypothetical protein